MNIYKTVYWDVDKSVDAEGGIGKNSGLYSYVGYKVGNDDREGD